MSFALAVDQEIQLRLVQPQHAAAIADVVATNRSHLARWLPWATDTYGLSDARQWIEMVCREFAERKQLALSILQQGQLVGGIGWTDWRSVNRSDWGLTESSADIGYWLAEATQGQGIVTRAVGALVDYGFAEVGLQRITIRAEPQNTRSCAVPERLGFQLEGTLRHVCFWHGRWIDHRCYAMLSDDWKR